MHILRLGQVLCIIYGSHYPFYEVFMLNGAFHCFSLGDQGVWILGQLSLGISQPQTNEQSLSVPEASACENF